MDRGHVAPAPRSVGASQLLLVRAQVGTKNTFDAVLSSDVIDCGAVRFAPTGKAASWMPSYFNSSLTFLLTPGKGRRLG